MTGEPRFLVLDGYTKEGREELRSGGAATGGEQYDAMLRRLCPGAAVDILYPADPSAALPAGAAINQYDGIAWTGSSLTVYADDPNVRRQIDFARAAFEAKVPSFGSCWAAQVAVVAAGGVVAAHPRGRAIFIARKIQLTPEGRTHPLYRDKKSVFDAWTSHVDVITQIPHGAQVLAGSDWADVQALSVTHRGGIFWAVQYHPEYDAHEMARLMFCRKRKLASEGFFPDAEGAQSMIDDLEALHREPGRKDIAFRYGIDADLMDPDIRQAEVRNWIERLVLPNMGT